MVVGRIALGIAVGALLGGLSFWRYISAVPDPDIGDDLPVFVGDLLFGGLVGGAVGLLWGAMTVDRE